MAASPSSLPEALGRFETAIAQGAVPARLRELGDSRFVGLLFRLGVRRLVRMGPRHASPGPAGLLLAAQEAASIGVAPVSAVVAVRNALDEAAERVRTAGAWRRDRRLWWEPLPPLSELEAIWASLEASLRQPAATAAELLGDDPPWSVWPRLVPEDVCSALVSRLERLHAAGRLGLDAGRIGPGAGTVTAARADEVRYLDGFEADLLHRAPACAALAQWGLERLAPHLAGRVADREIFPPGKVMLARYPGPSPGFRPHLDNPGGEADNGRALSCVLYLNSSSTPCVGGELALWRPGREASAAPDEVVSVGGGAAALFDARRARHEVRPLGSGPPRWSVAVWLNEAPQRTLALPALPGLSPTEVLLPVHSPPLPSKRLLRHELDEAPIGLIVAGAAGRRRRAGIVATVCGEGERLESWCKHHLAIGFEHLVLVFDRIEDPEEAATAAALRSRFPASRLTLWSGAELAARRWEKLAAAGGLSGLLAVASRGASPQAVASRQTLNATAALAAASTDELGGRPLDWLAHLDGDELFHLEGRGRGGREVGEHFGFLSRAGITLARYVNHELLLPRQSVSPPRFKRNPRWAAARLGTTGWALLVEDLRMGPSDRRPYFHGYTNGKAAVWVDRGKAAAGVHGWTIDNGGRSRLLSGPSVLHFHFASTDRQVGKLLAMAAESEAEGPPLFEPCSTEVRGRDVARSLLEAGASEREIRRRLLELRGELARFSPAEEEILEDAGLLFEPSLTFPLSVDPIESDPRGPDEAGTRSGDRAPGSSADGRPGGGRGRTGAAVSEGAPGEVRSVGVLGGGTAGLLAAIALRRRLPRLEVTQLESPGIPVIGVGEATTPLMPQFLHADLGLGVNELFDAVRPTLKLGIRFDWELKGSGWFNYPFGPLRVLEPMVHDGALTDTSLWSVMMDEGKIPAVPGGPENDPLEPGVEIAYHLDNERFVRWLQRLAGASRVRRIECTIEDVATSADRGWITQLVAEDGRRFEFDLYLDCSGFRSLLLGRALETPFHSFADMLPADSAVTAVEPVGRAIDPYTRAEKMNFGWCWSTPQPKENHLGYVFSSHYATPEAAWMELLRRHPNAVRRALVQFRSGRRQEAWKGNVVALGNAYGFVEPLESTALHLLIRQLGLLLAALDGEPAALGSARERLNRRVGDWWDYLAWFLALHYRFDPSPGSAFWEACAREVDVSRYGAILEAFRELGPLSCGDHGEVVTSSPDPLWGAEGVDVILLGQRHAGRMPPPGLSRAAWARRVGAWRALARRATTQRAWLAQVRREREPLVSLERAFHERGRAYP